MQVSQLTDTYGTEPELLFVMNGSPDRVYAVIRTRPGSYASVALLMEGGLLSTRLKLEAYEDVHEIAEAEVPESLQPAIAVFQATYRTY
jgi:hypothetical protein